MRILALKQLAVLLAPFLVSCGMEVTKKPFKPQLGEAATFRAVQDRVISVSCLRCHQPGGSAGDWPFTTYDEVISFGGISAGDPDSSGFYNDIVSGYMPKGGPKLSPELVALIRAWIQSGALNN